MSDNATYDVILQNECEQYNANIIVIKYYFVVKQNLSVSLHDLFSTKRILIEVYKNLKDNHNFTKNAFFIGSSICFDSQSP